MSRALLLGLLLAAGLGPGRSAWAQFARDYVTEPAPETEAERALRLQRVAERRSRPAILVHRGAGAFAPENTLEAYAAAMDYGADGVEVDVRRTRDGVLVLFHDDMLDRATHAFGEVGQLTGRELLATEPREAFGRPAGGSAPSLIQLLELARPRGMLLHLDLKEPGLEDDVARLLDATGTWEHVVGLNEANAPKLARDPRYRPLRYKTSGLYVDRQDLDPGVVAAALARPGELLLVDDPRVAAQALRRPRYEPETLTRTFRLTRRPPEPPPATATNTFNPFAHVQALTAHVNPDSVPELLALLRASPPGLTNRGPDPRAARIVERAWAADRLGATGRDTGDVVRALEAVLRERTPHPDWRYHCLDGALAARALGRLGARGSAALVVEAFEQTTPGATALTNVAAAAALPPGWVDARFKLHLLPALGDLRCRAAKRFLKRYVGLEAAQVSGWSPPMFEDATRALLRQNVDWVEIADLLRSANPAVRGTAVEECVDRPNDERGRALRAAAPWALSLPRPVPPPARPASGAGAMRPPKLTPQ